MMELPRIQLYNPEYPPHAKFHNAQTMVLGAFLGILSMYCLWAREAIDEKQRLKETVVTASLYWIAQYLPCYFRGHD